MLHWSITIVVLEVPLSLNRDRTPAPILSIGPSLNSVLIHEDIPALGSATIIAGDIMDLHSSSVSVQAGSGYFNFALMLVCRAVHASSLDGCPSLILPAQSSSAFLKFSIVLCLSPFGVI